MNLVKYKKEEIKVERRNVVDTTCTIMLVDGKFSIMCL